MFKSIKEHPLMTSNCRVGRGVQNDPKASDVKGQIISKANYGILNSSKKRTNKFDFTTVISQVNLFLFVFLEEIEDTKETFRN